MIGMLTSKPIIVDGKEFIFKLRFLNGDNKAIWFFLNNNCGGNLKCGCCVSNFSSEKIKENLFYNKFTKFKKKGLYENFIKFVDGFKKKLKQEQLDEIAKEYGLSASPYFAEGMFLAYHQNSIGIEQFLLDLQEIMVGQDNLHNIRGWNLALIDALKDSNRLNVLKYNKLLNEYKIPETACNGEKLRLLIVNKQ
jgi:hypothetical protein